jgi:hypothetical protein
MARFAQLQPFNDPARAAVPDWNPSLVVLGRGAQMGTTVDHRRCAEQCVAMARLAEDRSDKALWLTLAQSWVRSAEDVAQVEMSMALGPANDDEAS